MANETSNAEDTQPHDINRRSFLKGAVAFIGSAVILPSMGKSPETLINKPEQADTPKENLISDEYEQKPNAAEILALKNIFDKLINPDSDSEFWNKLSQRLSDPENTSGNLTVNRSSSSPDVITNSREFRYWFGEKTGDPSLICTVTDPDGGQFKTRLLRIDIPSLSEDLKISRGSTDNKLASTDKAKTASDNYFKVPEEMKQRTWSQDISGADRTYPYPVDSAQFNYSQRAYNSGIRLVVTYPSVPFIIR